MKRWLPFPLISAFLLAMWLLLNETVAPGHWLLGALFAWAVPFFTRQMQPVRAQKVRRLVVMVQLFFVVLFDICRSCLAVSMVILGPAKRRQNSGFMTVPLDMQAPHGLAMLACILCCTPGTVWVELSADRRQLMLHILDLHDEEWWTHTIKQRYETPLRMIFE
ncbi:putative monovalent cation/H+ antiporter subunit E [Alcanivorax sp. S71-1-4]|jgi:multicomponent K+:H+ antiporter subunit E|uniref:Na+/H+ antiporter subunit E n=1 Tax=Alcanivorax sp. S71-1-4 TaxID=1177159 RepID=UPI001357D7E7|nr:Na+/H+ antiporter subunit E [Alcanivorax sp. S71-1-4]KAF0810044.1 putative monovalent cation/H+ antiporter subunit E [Alcanivorax sp. S71-1-4]